MHGLRMLFMLMELQHHLMRWCLTGYNNIQETWALDVKNVKDGYINNSVQACLRFSQQRNWPPIVGNLTNSHILVLVVQR